MDEALRYGVENQVTVYDAYYIILARKHDTLLYTADEKILRKLGGGEPRIRHHT